MYQIWLIDPLLNISLKLFNQSVIASPIGKEYSGQKVHIYKRNIAWLTLSAYSQFHDNSVTWLKSSSHQIKLMLLSFHNKWSIACENLSSGIAATEDSKSA